MVGARWSRLDKAILACARGRCFGQQLKKKYIFFFLPMYIAWTGFQNEFSNCFSNVYLCALVNCFYLIRIKLLLKLMVYYLISSLFICDSYATMWWPIIGNKFYSILFYSILFYSYRWSFQSNFKVNIVKGP